MDVDAVLAKLSDRVSAGRAFGPVIERDDCLVIPAAYVFEAGGGGLGAGPPAGPSSGSGGGAGNFSLSWPIGAYVVRGGEATWVPAFDATRVAVAVIVVTKLALKLRAARHRGSGS